MHSDGSTETDLFCECLENVVNDCSLVPRQTDPLNILEPWKKLVAIDNGEMVRGNFIFEMLHGLFAIANFATFVFVA